MFTADSEKDVYTIRKDLAGYDYVIIDGVGALSVITAAAAMVSDLVIILKDTNEIQCAERNSVIMRTSEKAGSVRNEL